MCSSGARYAPNDVANGRSYDITNGRSYDVTSGRSYDVTNGCCGKSP